MLDLLAELNADDGGRRDPRPAPIARAHGRAARHAVVDPAKDVDGFHPLNAGRLFLGEPLHVPATPLGVMQMLEEYGVELKGKEAVVIGRSEIVGKPMAMLLLAEHATVTICHSRTEDLARSREARRHPRRRGRSSRPRDAGHGEAGRDRHRRGRQPDGVRPLRRRRQVGGRGGRPGSLPYPAGWGR